VLLEGAHEPCSKVDVGSLERMPGMQHRASLAVHNTPRNPSLSAGTCGTRCRHSSATRRGASCRASARSASLVTSGSAGFSAPHASIPECSSSDAPHGWAQHVFHHLEEDCPFAAFPGNGALVFCQVCYEDCYYFRPPTVADLDQLDLPAAFAYFCRSFQNPAEFTICFTGSLQVGSLQRLPDLKPLSSAVWLLGKPGPCHPSHGAVVLRCIDHERHACYRAFHTVLGWCPFPCSSHEGDGRQCR
jgi:hypothetical protein